MNIISTPLNIISRAALIAVLYIIMNPGLFAQSPTHIPTGTEPVNFFESWENIIVYILLPVIVVVLYYLWRKQRARQKDNPNS